MASLLCRALVDGRFDIPSALVDAMIENVKAWRAEHFVEADGCFQQSDTWDGGEDSISGGGCRVSINSVMVSSVSHTLSIAIKDVDGGKRSNAFGHY